MVIPCLEHLLWTRAPIVGRDGDPVGSPRLERLAGGAGFRKPFAGQFRDEVTLDFGEHRKQRGHDLGPDIPLEFGTNGFLDRDECGSRLCEAVNDGDDPSERAPGPVKFAHD